MGKNGVRDRANRRESLCEVVRAWDNDGGSDLVRTNGALLAALAKHLCMILVGLRII